MSPEANLEIYVDNKQRNNLSSRYEKGDFSSAGYPFEDEEQIYLGGIPDPDRQSISLKYGFYILANASDELLEQYPLVGPLLQKKDDPQFRDRLFRGLKQLFSPIHQRIKAICDRNRLHVTAIGLSIPAQWTLDFEDVYRGIVAQVFKHPSSDIFFHTETVALAHHLFTRNAEEFELIGDMDVVLFFDFGGHNMVRSRVGFRKIYPWRC